MDCINATSLRRKSGQMGHPTFVAGAGNRVIAVPTRAAIRLLPRHAPRYAPRHAGTGGMTKGHKHAAASVNTTLESARTRSAQPIIVRLLQRKSARQGKQYLRG